MPEPNWAGRDTATAADGAGSGPQTAAITLTDDQIKALPTTGATLVAAPGTGKIVFPTWGIVSMRYPSGTGYTAAIGASWQLLWPGSPTIEASGYIKCVNVSTGNIPATTGQTSHLWLIPPALGVAGRGWLVTTGGNASNTLTITIGYQIIDV